MVKGSIQHEDNTCKYYAPNIGAPKNKKKTLTDTKAEIGSNIITSWEFNTPFTSRDKSYRQKINKEYQS